MMRLWQGKFFPIVFESVKLDFCCQMTKAHTVQSTDYSRVHYIVGYTMCSVRIDRLRLAFNGNTQHVEGVRFL